MTADPTIAAQRLNTNTNTITNNHREPRLYIITTTTMKRSSLPGAPREYVEDGYSLVAEDPEDMVS